MKTQKLKVIGLLLGLTMVSQANAQFSVNGQYMSRGELRHGFGTLTDTSQSPGIFISQRARLGAEYKHEKFKMNVSVQDVRTWGSVANAAIDTKGLLSIYEANTELLISKKWGLKIGRQAISYDDDRIFGSLDWAMQGRRHDAAILKYRDSTWSVDGGFAFNQNGESNKLTQYTVNNYKNFQYLWVNKKLGKGNYSFLFLNNGMAYNELNTATGITDSITAYSQTLGIRGDYKTDKFNFLGHVYYQMGKVGAKDLSAYDLMLEVGYKPAKGFLITLGAELLSGTSQIDTANKVNNSFNPFYGTNHRFNGYMDYFYVGNHLNNVGLLDGYLLLSYTKNKLIFSLNGHYFSAAADVWDPWVTTELAARNPHLGAEVDFTMLYNYSDGVSFQGGYSQFFGTGTLQQVKGGSTSISASSNWAYLMLIVRPNNPMKFPKVGLKM
jgi:hypothetical protein